VATKKRKKKRRRREASGRKGGGVMTGMRSGFKGVAGTVSGKSKPKSKKGAFLSTAMLVLVLVAAIALFMSR